MTPAHLYITLCLITGQTNQFQQQPMASGTGMRAASTAGVAPGQSCCGAVGRAQVKKKLEFGVTKK